MEKQEVKIAVRTMIEFILRSGDINLGGIGPSPELLREGTRIHRRLQKEAPEGYKSEVRLSCRMEYDTFFLKVDGIADGIMTADGRTVLDEIKTVSTSSELPDYECHPMHWAQAQCYAYMHALAENLDEIDIRLIYFNTQTEQTKYLQKTFTFGELQHFFIDLAQKYYRWANADIENKSRRDISIKNLDFPFINYRKGQRQLAVSVYKTIRDKGRLFAQAPTGTGKTVSTLYPAIKAMGEGFGGRIFYITAKTITRQVAEEALFLMQGKGLDIKAITLTAKDRICPMEVKFCNPENCPRAKGHFDRVNDAIFDILRNESIIFRDVLIRYAEAFCVCPFEYQLDVALRTDVIICDYNHVFDPRAYLRRFFEFGGDYILLTDEAHNLIDRAREMFSAELSKNSFMACRKLMKGSSPDLNKALNRLNKYFITLRKTYCKNDTAVTVDLPADITTLAENFVAAMEAFLAQYKGPVDQFVIGLFFDSISFLLIRRLFDYRYKAYINCEDGDVKLKLFCMDPSGQLSGVTGKLRSSIFFSATLTPLSYFKDMLGGNAADNAFMLPSPFERDNLCLMVAGNLSTRYKDRSKSYDTIARYIKSSIGVRIGNYLVFFPSFDYMRNVYNVFTEKWPDINTIIQQSNMSETGREHFLAQFAPSPASTLAGFAVMGGIFSEGIDLPGDRLSGAVITGVGLPQLSFERDLICGFFNEKMKNGYEYAYIYPGMNRVLQAAGRVIRTETDRGFVLLLDDRFLERRYLELFPVEWNGFFKITSPANAGAVLGHFVNNAKNLNTL